MTFVTPTLYDEALYGQPCDRIVQVANDVRTIGDGIWALQGWQIRIPELRTTATLDTQRFVAETRARTGWSARRLAEIVGTSHTTIRRIEQGGRVMAGHSGDLPRRLADAHGVISRLYIVAGRNPRQTARLLEQTAPSGLSAMDLLQADEPSRAYLAALDVASPSREGLLVGNRPRTEDATSALHD